MPWRKEAACGKFHANLGPNIRLFLPLDPLALGMIGVEGPCQSLKCNSFLCQIAGFHFRVLGANSGEGPGLEHRTRMLALACMVTMMSLQRASDAFDVRLNSVSWQTASLFNGLGRGRYEDYK
ncbi:unnamed protein product [Caretta caretta]